MRMGYCGRCVVFFGMLCLMIGSCCPLPPSLAARHTHWPSRLFCPSLPQFVCNGLLWPDRSLHPAAYEVKQLQAPLGVSLAGTAGTAAGAAVGVTAGGEGQGGAQQPQPQQQQQQQQQQALEPGSEVRLLLRNKQQFSSTAGLALHWRLLADGLPVAAGTAGAAASAEGTAAGAGAGGNADSEGWQPLQLPQHLGAQQEAAVGLGVSWAELAQWAQQGAEATLEVQAQVGWAAAGWLAVHWCTCCGTLSSKGRGWMPCCCVLGPTCCFCWRPPLQFQPRANPTPANSPPSKVNPLQTQPPANPTPAKTQPPPSQPHAKSTPNPPALRPANLAPPSLPSSLRSSQPTSCGHPLGTKCRPCSCR